MNNDEHGQLREELERQGDRKRGRSGDPDAVELEHYLSQLTDAVSAFTHMGFRSILRHDPRAELLTQIDSLLEQTGEIYRLAGRVREVLLRPPPEDKEPGFTE